MQAIRNDPTIRQEFEVGSWKEFFAETDTDGVSALSLSLAIDVYIMYLQAMGL